MTENRLSYGGEAHPEPETVATILSKLQEYGEEHLGPHSTIEVRTWDDGTIEAVNMETVDILPGAGGVQPATTRREVRYKSGSNVIMYRDVLDRAGGETEVQNKDVIETEVLEE